MSWFNIENEGFEKENWANIEQGFATKLINIISKVFENIWNSWMWIIFMMWLILSWVFTWFDFQILAWTEPIKKILVSVAWLAMIWAFVTPLYSEVKDMNKYFIWMWRVREVEWKEIIKLAFQWIFWLVLFWLTYISFQSWSIASNVFSKIFENNWSFFEMVWTWFSWIISLIIFLVVSWAVYWFLLSDMNIEESWEEIQDKVIKSWVVAFIVLFLTISITWYMESKYWEVTKQVSNEQTIDDLDSIFK